MFRKLTEKRMTITSRFIEAVTVNVNTFRLFVDFETLLRKGGLHSGQNHESHVDQNHEFYVDQNHELNVDQNHEFQN